jgi:hypothetical protein
VFLPQQQNINKRLGLDKDGVQALANDNTPQDEQVADTFVECLEASRIGYGH